MNSRPASDLHFVNKRDPMPTVEVSVDSLQENQLSLDAILAPALRRIATAHPEIRATINIYSSPSFNFNNTAGYSDFLIVAGPKKVLHQVHAALERSSDVRCRYSEYIRLDQGSPAYHLEDGQLWEPEDSLTWFTRTPSTASVSAPVAKMPGGEDLSPQVWPFGAEDSSDEADSSEPAPPEADPAVSRGGEQAARYRAARSDATVARIRQTIEEVFGLPAGSVALCGPDGRALRGDALIKTLRRRWEDN